MKKTYKLMLMLVLMALSTANVKAELISLDEVPFCSWDGWGADAKSTGEATCAFVLNESTGQPYGDPSVNNYSDLSNYTKLIITSTEGTPRIMMNRDQADGQYSDTESDSHLIEYPKCAGGWAGKYFKSETVDGVMTITVDLKAISKDKGFAHLHAIKGANWQNTTVTSMMVEQQAKAPVGWTSIINNGNLEGEDASSFRARIYPDTSTPVPEATIAEGAGVDGGRGIMVEATAKNANAWDNQFFILFNEPVPAGTQYRISFDYRADAVAKVSTQAHAQPADYIHYEMLGDLQFSTEWQTFTKEGTISESQSTAEKAFQSIAFNLNEIAEANNYYFDNLKFEVFKLGTVAEFSNDVICIDFGFDTNVAELVKQSGKRRLLFPEGTASVKVNGEDAELYSIEGFADGRFYVFLNEAADEDAEVEVTFTNPTDAAYHLVYASGAVSGQDVKDFTGVATLNAEVEENEGYPYDFLTPTVMTADPEDGSFNLSTSIKEFKFVFDKEVDCEAIVATLNSTKLTANPAEGFASEITFTREGANLGNGEYILNVTKIYPKLRLADEVFGDTTLVLNVGPVVVDPTDVEELVMTDDFAASGASWIVTADAGGMQDANSGSGSRLMHGQSGFAADILYLCTRGTTQGMALYGTKEDAKLTLKAKTYHLTLGAAKWDGGGAARQLTVQVFSEADIDASDGAILNEALPIVEETKSIEPDFKTSANATRFDIKVPVSVAGNYIIRMLSSDGSGNPGGYNDGSAIGDIKVQYLPNTVGAEYIRLLKGALESAKAYRDKYAGERYEGEAFTALDNAINKYESEMHGYTNPSAYKNAAADLEELSAALESHGKLCDEYDTQVKKGIDVVRQNEQPNGDPTQPTKFVVTELFGQVKATVEKYHGRSEWRNVADTIADPTAEEWQLFYFFDSLKVESELNVAIAELKEVVNKASLLFTEGVSATGDCGTKVLVDRLRRGAATLDALGVEDTDELMVAANRALTDDDELAEKLMIRIKTIVYEDLAKGEESELFKPLIDPETLAEIIPTYDMSVFAKNPNAYAWKVSDGFNEENVPGWTVPMGNTGLSTMWVGGTPRNVDGIAEDIAFSTYRAEARIEQTIIDLPVGIYTVILDAASWADDDVTNGFVYVKTSQTPVPEEGEIEDPLVHFAAISPIEYYGQYQGHHDHELKDIVITDGVLTFGANFGAGSQWMFDQVKAINMTGPAAGFDYKKAYEEIITTEIVDAPAPVRVKAVGIYDLNGRRLTVAPRGFYIVKTLMSDGTVRTTKAVRK